MPYLARATLSRLAARGEVRARGPGKRPRPWGAHVGSSSPPPACEVGTRGISLADRLPNVGSRLTVHEPPLAGAEEAPMTARRCPSSGRPCLSRPCVNRLRGGRCLLDDERGALPRGDRSGAPARRALDPPSSGTMQPRALEPHTPQPASMSLHRFTVGATCAREDIRETGRVEGAADLHENPRYSPQACRTRDAGARWR
jgi:hypothetical protein